MASYNAFCSVLLVLSLTWHLGGAVDTSSLFTLKVGTTIRQAASRLTGEAIVLGAVAVPNPAAQMQFREQKATMPLVTASVVKNPSVIPGADFVQQSPVMFQNKPWCPFSVSGDTTKHYRECPHESSICCVGHNTCCPEGFHCEGRHDAPSCVRRTDFHEQPAEIVNNQPMCPFMVEDWVASDGVSPLFQRKRCPEGTNSVCCVGHNTCCGAGFHCDGTKPSPLCILKATAATVNIPADKQGNGVDGVESVITPVLVTTTSMEIETPAEANGTTAATSVASGTPSSTTSSTTPITASTSTAASSASASMSANTDKPRFVQLTRRQMRARVITTDDPATAGGSNSSSVVDQQGMTLASSDTTPHTGGLSSDELDKEKQDLEVIREQERQRIQNNLREEAATKAVVRQTRLNPILKRQKKLAEEHNKKQRNMAVWLRNFNQINKLPNAGLGMENCCDEYGYDGDDPDIKKFDDRGGACPPAPAVPGNCASACNADADCALNNTRCCSNGCGRQCMTPLPPSYNSTSAGPQCSPTNACPAGMWCRCGACAVYRTFSNFCGGAGCTQEQCEPTLVCRLPQGSLGVSSDTGTCVSGPA